MTTPTRLMLCLPLLAQAACLDYDSSTVAERRLERAFRVAAGSVVRIDLSSGSVTTATGPDGIVEVFLTQQARSSGGERAADELLSATSVTATQAANEVRIFQRRVRDVIRSGRWWERTDLKALVTVPSNVTLDLVTRGGNLRVRGDRSAEVRARTGGGSISADGGTGGMLLSTGGGNIKVGRALGLLQADTSGGSLSVDYVGQSARVIELGTSGGSIHVGIDPTAPLTLVADTGGGRIDVEDMDFVGYAERRSNVSGTLNGGKGGTLRASTGGGSITLQRASDPGVSVASYERQ